jgi:hypothetical protein
MFGVLGERIDSLVTAVTEPPKSAHEAQEAHENYIARKTKVVANLVKLRETDPSQARDAAAIVCAAKMSTMRDGHYFGFNYTNVQPWTKGTWIENTRAMCTLHDMFVELGIDSALREAYLGECTRWVDLSGHIPAPPDHFRGHEKEKAQISWSDGVPLFRAERVEVGERLTELYREVMTFHSTKIENGLIDATALLRKTIAAMGGSTPRSIPVDPARATRRELTLLIHEIGREVFLPQGLFLFNRVNWGWSELISGVIEERDVQTYDYLGRKIGVSHARFSHGRFNIGEVSFLVGGEVFIDRHLSAIQGLYSFGDIQNSALREDPRARGLLETLVKRRTTEEKFSKVCWYDRLLFRGLAYAEANRYLELLNGVSHANMCEIGETSGLARDPSKLLAALLAPGSAEVTIESARGRNEILIYFIDLTGLLKQLEHYSSKGDFDAAEVMFRCHYWFARKLGAETQAPEPRREYFAAAMEARLPLDFLEEKMFAGNDREGDLHMVINAVRDAYNYDFYSADEKIERILANAQALGRQLPPGVFDTPHD